MKHTNLFRVAKISKLFLLLMHWKWAVLQYYGHSQVAMPKSIAFELHCRKVLASPQCNKVLLLSPAVPNCGTGSPGQSNCTWHQCKWAHVSSDLSMKINFHNNKNSKSEEYLYSPCLITTLDWTEPSSKYWKDWNHCCFRDRLQENTHTHTHTHTQWNKAARVNFANPTH